MLMDIFSSFDPHMNYFSSTIQPMIWLASSSILCLIHASFWISPNWTFWSTSPMLATMSTQVHRTTGLHMKGFNSILPPLFITIIASNLMGLTPYLFSTTSHLAFTLSLALPLWMMLILSAIFKDPKSVVAHLLPSNTPDWLSPPIILIESVSILVRPITLPFRLAANMSAGHIVLMLISICLSVTMFSSKLTTCFLIPIQMMYILFEAGICLIQAYIFCLLLSLYSDEHPS